MNKKRGIFHPNPAKSALLKVRVTPMQKDKLQAHAQKCNVSLSDFARNTLIKEIGM